MDLKIICNEYKTGAGDVFKPHLVIGNVNAAGKKDWRQAGLPGAVPISAEMMKSFISGKASMEPVLKRAYMAAKGALRILLIDPSRTPQAREFVKKLLDQARAEGKPLVILRVASTFQAYT